jgi:hypothetical protein
MVPQLHKPSFQSPLSSKKYALFSGHNSSSTHAHRGKPPAPPSSFTPDGIKSNGILANSSEEKGSSTAQPGAAEESHLAMPKDPIKPGPFNRIRRAVIEVAFIIFLFYSNLLMGEFNHPNGTGKTFAVALYDIFTIKNLAIAITAASIGYIVFEYLRKKP